MAEVTTPNPGLADAAAGGRMEEIVTPADQRGAGQAGFPMLGRAGGACPAPVDREGPVHEYHVQS
jgi:hypothetical protein